MARWLGARLALWLGAMSPIAALACSSSDKAPSEGAPAIVPFTCPDLAADASHVVVLVEDSGFDLSLPVFQDKIAGCYSITCPELPDEPADFAGAKAARLRELTDPTLQCTLAPGLSLRKSTSLATIENQRDAWNAKVRAHAVDAQASADFIRILEGETSYLYHGTWTSSLVAYDNPNVRIVFVDRPLLKSTQKPPCPSAAEVTTAIALANDPDVQAATVAAQPIDAEIAAMLVHHGVTLTSESFGPESLAAAQKRCPDVATQLRDLATAESALEGKRELARYPIDYANVSLLDVRAAGNDGVEIDNAIENGDCATSPDVVPLGPKSGNVMIGSVDASGPVSSFSNTGACVAGYAPGKDIVVEGPDGFLNVVSGTSFSAPLTARYLSLAFKRTTTPSDMVTAIAFGLPLSDFPSALLYDQGMPTADGFTSARATLSIAAAPRSRIGRRPW